MKFFAYTALVAGAAADVHKVCEKTWEGAADPACAADTEQCFDWQDETKTTSKGLMCGLTANCNTVFNWTKAEGGDDVNYYAECTGLSMTKCDLSKANADCDEKANFKCADWTKDGTTDTMCAADATECGKNIDSGAGGKYDVACHGFEGQTCAGGAFCDDKAGFKCAMEFNNETLKFTNATNKCMKAADCGTGKDNKTTYLCYGDVDTSCNETVKCETPANDNGEATCGYFHLGDKNITSTGMCIDKSYCNTSNATAGANATYYGVATKLFCGSVQTGLTIGAAVVSAYLAM